MKKFLALMLALVMALALVACGQQKEPDVQEPQGPTDTDEVTYKVAMITDYGDITDQSLPRPTAWTSSTSSPPAITPPTVWP